MMKQLAKFLLDFEAVEQWLFLTKRYPCQIQIEEDALLIAILRVKLQHEKNAL